ncbi:MAG TPA: 4'-phosphopantetheinyl transferase superfamily protein [Candidatus Levybacteria bacterium]|nr:4'-phosphopantetheinyl transferase superfamily protein [Candidatus Levybacteria bacterium]
MIGKELRDAVQELQEYAHESELESSPSPIGVQVVKVQRVANAIQADPGFVDRIYTSAEIDYCKGKTNSLSGRLAAKSAVMHVIGNNEWQDISIVPLPTRQPIVRLSGTAAQSAEQKNIRDISISISHDEGLSVALAVSMYDQMMLKTGVDIAPVDRIASLYTKYGNHFLYKVFSPREAEYANGNPDILTRMWGGKESVVKILGTGDRIGWSDIEVLPKDDSSTTSAVNLYGAAHEHSVTQGIKDLHVSVLPFGDNRIAFALATY